MIAAFLQHLASERRLSPHTVQAYAIDLKQCAAYLHTLDPDSEFGQATHQSLRTWIAALAQQGLNSRSIKASTSFDTTKSSLSTRFINASKFLSFVDLSY